MAVTVPTLSDLYTSIRDDLKNKLGITSIVGKVVLNALAAVQAAKLKILYILADDIYKNIFVDTADGEMLARFGLVKLGRVQAPATAGVYDLDITGDDGATIVSGTTYAASDSSRSPGTLFVLDTDYTISGTTGTISVRALTLGTDAALNVGDQLQVTAPIANVDSFGIISAVTTNPVNAESDEEFRAEVIEAYQLEAQGGARTDYRLWSSDAAGVREVYPYAISGQIGLIDLYVEANAADSTDGNGTPPAAMLTEVEAVVEFDPDTTKPLNERGRRPLSAFQINFLIVLPLAVDVEITNLSDTSYLTTIKDNLTAFLLDIRPFIGGADNPQDLNKGKLYEFQVQELVIDTIGINATYDSLVLKVDGNAVNSYEFTGGNIPYANNVTNA